MKDWLLNWLKASGASTVILMVVVFAVGVSLTRHIDTKFAEAIAHSDRSLAAAIHGLKTNDLAHAEVRDWENTLWDDLERRRELGVVDIHYQSYKNAIHKCEPPVESSYLLCAAVEEYLKKGQL